MHILITFNNISYQLSNSYIHLVIQVQLILILLLKRNIYKCTITFSRYVFTSFCKYGRFYSYRSISVSLGVQYIGIRNCFLERLFLSSMEFYSNLFFGRLYHSTLIFCNINSSVRNALISFIRAIRICNIINFK